jgi:hypothetical protein
MGSNKTYRDPFGSGASYSSARACETAVYRMHRDQLDLLGVTARQAIFNHRNRQAVGTTSGRSVLSGRPTSWNEPAGRYERFADDSERAKYRESFLERMRRVHGRDHLLDDPDQQRRMLAARSISGSYEFRDGSRKTYTGSEELALLRFLDDALGWPGVDVHMPAPQNFSYVGEDGKNHTYIPDAYLESLNLIVEVKGERHNGFRAREHAVETAKDEVLGTSGYNYVKVEQQSYGDLLDAMESASAD